MARTPEGEEGGPGPNQQDRKPRRGGAAAAVSAEQQEALHRGADADLVFLTQPGAIDPGLAAARTALLDTLERLGPQAGALTLIGAQAVYERTSAVDLPELAPATGDADFVVEPDLLLDDPQIGAVMTAAGFSVRADRPGIWVKSDLSVSVDFLVPHTFAGAGRRSARLPHPQGHNAVGRAAGVELALFDRGTLAVAGLEEGDGRVGQVNVAGHAALLCGKSYKLAERLADRTRPDRVRPKDAADVYRLILATEPEQVRPVFAAAEGRDRFRDTGETGRRHLRSIFGAAGPGATLVATALGVDGTEKEHEIRIRIADWLDRFERG